MAFISPTAKYRGQINTVHLGKHNLPIGGQKVFNLHYHEGELPYPPRFALDVWDFDPGDNWPEALTAVYEGVRHDPGLWAQKCVEDGADIIILHLKSTLSYEQNSGPQEAVKSVGRVLEAVDAPIIVMGVDHPDKDVEILSAVAEAFSGQKLALGPLTARNYKRLGAQALVHGHSVIALSPTDFNLAKQLNILLYSMGLPKDRIIMDPTAAALGYGMEYCYSVMEQLQIAALLLDDEDAQHPIISFFGEDTWRTREASKILDNSNGEGQGQVLGISLESADAVTMMTAGASILSMRHPQALAEAKAFLGEFLKA